MATVSRLGHAYAKRWWKCGACGFKVRAYIEPRRCRKCRCRGGMRVVRLGR